MQIKIFTIPIMGGGKLLEEMTVFLRSKKVLQVEQHLVQEVGGLFATSSCWYAPPRSANKQELVANDIMNRSSLGKPKLLRFSYLLNNIRFWRS